MTDKTDSKEREALRSIGEEQAFEAWFKVDCPVEGANAKIAAKAAWKARASLAASAGSEPVAQLAAEGPDLQPLHNLLYLAQRQTSLGVMQRVVGDARLELAKVRDAAAKPTRSATEQRNTPTHDLLSLTVGALMGYKAGPQMRPGYKAGSALDNIVNEAVEHLKDWPYPEPTHAAQAGNQREARPCHVFTVRKAGPLTEWEPTTMALALPDGEHPLYTHPSPPEGMVGGWMPIETAPGDMGAYLFLCGGVAVEGFIDATGTYCVRQEAGSGWRKMWRKPTHWMPLPPPPTTSADSRKGE